MRPAQHFDALNIGQVGDHRRRARAIDTIDEQTDRGLDAGIVGAIAYPALAVYRGELFPTGNRATSSFLITVAALLGGSIGLVGAGLLVDSGWSYGAVMLSFASISLVVSLLIVKFYPETAHKDLEELNPQDAHVRFER